MNEKSRQIWEDAGFTVVACGDCGQDTVRKSGVNGVDVIRCTDCAGS